MQGFASVADYLLICRGRYLVCLVCQLRALQVCLQLFSCLVFRCLLLISVLLGALLSLSLRLQRSLTPFPILGRVTTRRLRHLFRVCQVVIAVRLYCRMVSAFSLAPYPCYRMFSLVHLCGFNGRTLFLFPNRSLLLRVFMGHQRGDTETHTKREVAGWSPGPESQWPPQKTSRLL